MWLDIHDKSNTLVATWLSHCGGAKLLSPQLVVHISIILILQVYLVDQNFFSFGFGLGTKGGGGRTWHFLCALLPS